MDERTIALQQIRTLINVASESDDLDLIYKHLRMMRNMVLACFDPQWPNLILGVA